MIDRAEGAGLTVALAGHVVLFGLLSVGFLATPNPEKLKPQPIEVTISDEVGLESMAPDPSTEAPAAKLSPVEAPLEPESAPPQPEAQPQPEARPQPAPPKPAPAPDARPAPKTPTRPTTAAPPNKPTPRNTAPTGRLDGIINGLTDKPSTSKSTTPPAATAGPEVRSALVAEIIRQIRPHWAPPSGADSEKLRTTVTVRLNPDGSLASEPQITQTGVTASNRAQAALARERAVRAVRLAAPFKLPAQYYSAWKTIAPVLYEDL